MPRLLFFLPIVLLACSQQQPETARTPLPEGPPAIPVQSGPPTQAAGRLLETFEAGSKGAYSTADETLETGPWHFEDALIGAADQDHKNGQHAARLRNLGRLRMNFDAPAPVRSIRISAAAYGDDPASTWELWGSVDGGRTFRRIGQPVRTQGPRLAVNTFSGGTTGRLRLEIRKIGGSGRLNIDDIQLETTAAGSAVAGSPAGAATGAPAGTSLPPATTGQATAVVTSRDDNMALGNPSGASSSASSLNNYLISKPQFSLGYHAGRGTPIWVSWHLNRAWIGEAPRQDDFRPDPALPRGAYAVTPRSYSGSGFDKGHNCPSADRTSDLDDNSATFLMTNMIPQAPNNNQRTWSSLEEWGRTQVGRGQEIYVIMGSYGKGGTGAKGFMTTLDGGRVTVPARVWKVLVLLPEGSDDLRRIPTQARVLAVDTPNDNAVSADWSQYRVSVDAIENATGLDLLSQLPVEVQARLEAQVDKGPTR
ncbi:DNA/RNA non-specific endonuclease [Hymenobacter sp. BT635]|uniref:DNA/RNA non-specific endonuclease n=1 Tax=Hymenobacter nitidus TaxID=2880929 RepID=A0ABS8A8F0_9BACT|nr:DNA/RNA non-specific endonuclease [Hymenobacter nitidus]MCB2376682.1 DNA/RNA non-specific endonuclease [Hymenobacter nitidus]